MFINPSEFLLRFEKLVLQATKVRIVSAWVTENRLLGVLENRRKNGSFRVETIAGTSSNLSHPNALKRLTKIGKLKLGDELSSRGVFHPKLYVFYRGDSATIWIGSANFTNGGFPKREGDGNYEVIFETKSPKQVEEFNKWFSKLWRELTLADKDTLLEYQLRWKKNPPSREASRAAGIPSDRPSPDLSLIEREHLVGVFKNMENIDGKRVRFGITGRFGKSEEGARPNYQIQLGNNDKELAFRGAQQYERRFKPYNLSDYYEIDEIEMSLELE